MMKLTVQNSGQLYYYHWQLGERVIRTAPAGGGGKRHSNIANVEREGLSGVGKGYGTFGGRVDGHEAEDSGSDGSKLSWVSWVAFRGRTTSDQEAEASPE